MKVSIDDLKQFKKSPVWLEILETLNANGEQALGFLRAAPQISTALVVDGSVRIIYGVEHWQGVFDQIESMKNVVDTLINHRLADVQAEQVVNQTAENDYE